MRVLAADDDEFVLRMLSRALCGWGYEPVLVKDGVEAWHALRNTDAPTVAILDWDMPGMSGVEVCRLLRATPQGDRCYVLVLTARQQQTDLIEALEAGADDFLSKPFSPRELQLRLAKGLSARGRRSRAPEREGSAAGATLAGKVRLERKIAEGGMATVWLGVHLALGINVAVKLMKTHLTDTADYASFEREARAVAKLRNEHIVRVYDHGIGDDGIPYLVMEFVGGDSLATRVDRDGPLSFEAVGAIVEQLGRALTEAHSHGIIHRDIKPENILLAEVADGPGQFDAKLVDFGLAKATAPNEAWVPTSLAGTPSYMSPEYLTGQSPPSPMLDLWALAATAFAAITGVPPFAGDSLHAIHMHILSEPLPLASVMSPGVPKAFDRWFEKACARAPEARFQSAAEMTAALSMAVANAGAVPSSQPWTTKTPAAFEQTEPDTARAMGRIAEATQKSRELPIPKARS